MLHPRPPGSCAHSSIFSPAGWLEGDPKPCDASLGGTGTSRCGTSLSQGAWQGHRRQALKAAYKENIKPLKDDERRLVLELNLARVSSVDDVGTTGPLYIGDFDEGEDDEGMVAQSMHCVVRRDPHSVLCGHGADVDRFCAFVVVRECMRRNRLQGQPPLDGVDPSLDGVDHVGAAFVHLGESDDI